MNEIGANANDWDRHFKLMADIDLSGFTGTDFNVIGIPWDNPFTGVFDGSGYTISNFSYTSTGASSIGLFGYVRGAVIKDLGLIAPNVDAGTGNRVGSLVGSLQGGTITNCYAEGGSISASGGWWGGVGGLVGRNYGTITNCYSSVSVSGDYSVGGLVGDNHFSELFAIHRGMISNCYSTGSVTGTTEVGGLVGRNYWGTITDSYATGSVSGSRNVGGLVGYNSDGTITNCYATGSVSGNERVGGLVGSNGPFWARAIITNCYSVGSVTGTTDVGGLVGWNDGSVYNSFWDIETSSQTTSAGGTGKTTAEMQMQSTFTDAGWDFLAESANGTEDIWWIIEGQDYPRLTWELVEEQ